MDNPPPPRVVKLGDILPSLANFESVLSSLKSYRLWPVVLREALLDKAISGIACSEEDVAEAWAAWCKRNEVDPAAPVFEGLSRPEMMVAAMREKKVEKFREQNFGKLIPEYFRSRKGLLDRVSLEVVQFHHAAVAEEALFRCLEGEQTLEEAAHELAHNDGGEPPIRKVGPIGMGRLSSGLAALVNGSRSGALLGPKKLGHYHCVVRVIEIREAALDTRMRNRLLEELLNNWVEQQIAAMTGRPPRSMVQDDGDFDTAPAFAVGALKDSKSNA
jgi:hypothetical protein